MKRLSTTSKKVERLRAWLYENPDELLFRIEATLTEALSRQDIAQVRCLVEAMELFVPLDRYVAQWQQYALGYLRQHDAHDATGAIAHLESLRVQLDGLHESLPKRVLNGLGILYEMEQRWDLASQRYLECIQIAMEDDDHLYLGKVYSNLTILHTQTGDYEAAIGFAGRSIEYLAGEPDEMDWQISLGGAWNQMGIACRDQGNLADAQIAFEHYQEILERWGVHERLCIAYNNLASVHMLLGDRCRAMELYERALDSASKNDNGHEEAEALSGLAQILATGPSDEIDQSLRLFDTALQLADQANHYELIVRTLLSRAEVHERRHELAAAREDLRTAIRNIESLRANIIVPEDRMRWQRTWTAAYERLVGLLIREERGYAEAFTYVEMAKSRVMAEMLDRGTTRIPDSVPEMLIEEERELRHTLSTLYASEKPGSEQIRILEAQLSSARERIQSLSAESDSLLGLRPLTLDQVMTRLPRDSVLLEFFTCGDALIAFVISSNEVRVTPLQIGLSRLMQAFETPQNEPYTLLNIAPDASGKLAQPWILDKLGEALLEPVNDVVSSASKLYLVPHGILHYIPFHALHYRDQEGKPVCLGDIGGQPRRIVYAPSATVLFEYCRQRQMSSNSEGLALGYNGLSLLHAESEVQHVADVLAGTALTGDSASSEALIEKGPSQRYIHISCHGKFNPTWPMASSLNLADGQLQPLDVLQDLVLDADLVTLSACDSGRSNVMRGEELIGLVRAFLCAGTPSVLVSQWVVDDLCTSLFMRRFYSELTKRSGDVSGVLANTQQYIRALTVEDLAQLAAQDGSDSGEIREWLNDFCERDAGDNEHSSAHDDQRRPFEHPYYWAPFFLVGESMT